MIHAGFVIESPLTQSRTVVLESDAETNGTSWLLEITCPPDTPTQNLVAATPDRLAEAFGYKGVYPQSVR